MPTPSKDNPTVGRIVWVWLSEDEQMTYGLEPINDDQPFRGEVLFVKTDTDPPLANLLVRGHSNEEAFIEDVQIFDPEEGDCHGDATSYATWMPYQKAQADKQRATELFKEAKAEEAGESARDAKGGFSG